MMALAEVIEHDQQRRQRARARQRRNGGRLLPRRWNLHPARILAARSLSVMARLTESCFAGRRNRRFGAGMDSLLPHLQSALGIIVIIAIAWAVSEDRRAFDWRIVAGGLGLQLALALLLRMVPGARDVLFGLN